ncbi:MAG: accessory Sec system protein Asp3 [Lachnospiraceae bacterium]|nr:accessory Sec system protein Asp3 [Lachnospiraceae bacterium]MDY6360636.1 accessory Sec system protein Asp3 [Lachnospiraceae bacterium]
MKDDTWVIRWREFLSDTYVYGSKIEFLEDQSVVYQNRLMPPGTVIHRWYSKTNFQRQRVEPTLPLIDGERAYEITSDISYNSPQSRELMLRIVFYDRYDVEAESIIVRNGQAVFKPSIKTYSYCVELINGGNADFTFRSLILREISKEEYDVRQERIKKLKESASKSKKKCGKNKKSE